MKPSGVSWQAWAERRGRKRLLVPVLALAIPWLPLALALSLNIVARADEIALEVEALSETAIVLRAAQAPSPNQTLAVLTEGGIVVVDPQPSPTLARLVRDRIVEHFGRDDFLYLIITHEDLDHIGGAQAYEDIEIVGHTRCYVTIRAIQRSLASQTEQHIAWYQERLDAYSQAVSSGELSAQQQVWGDTLIALTEAFLADLRSGEWRPPLPSVRVGERLELLAGTETIRIWYWGVGHSTSDLIIHFPEHGILATGDVFFPGAFPGPGVDPDSPLPFEPRRWIEILDLLAPLAFDHVAIGHRTIASREDFDECLAYTNGVWRTLGSLKDQGLTLAEARERVLLQDHFPSLELSISANAPWLLMPPDDVCAYLEEQHKTLLGIFWEAL